MSIKQSDYLDIQDAQHRRNAAALQAGNIGVFEFEPQSRRAFWDARVRQLWGAAPHEEIDYDYVISKVDPRDRKSHDAETANALDPNGPGQMDFEFRLLARPDQPETWIRTRAVCKFDDDKPIMLVGTVEDITTRKRAELRNELLLRELQHRLKNTMAVMATIVKQSKRTAQSVNELAASLDTRLRALSAAQDLLQRNSWDDLDISHILADTAKAFMLDETRLRTSWHAPCVIPENYVMSTSLALYELASNSLKYGALGQTDGHVQVSSQIDGDTTVFTWEENGQFDLPDGPLPQTGFGSVLLLKVLPTELRGAARYAVEDGKLTYRLRFTPGEVS